MSSVQGDTIFLNTWKPSQRNLTEFPHIVLSSPQPCNPHQIQFPATSYAEREELETRNVSATATTSEDIDDERERLDVIFDIGNFTSRVISSVRVSHEDYKVWEEQRKVSKTKSKETNPSIGPLEESELQPPKTFLSSERHSETTAEYLSER